MQLTWAWDDHVFFFLLLLCFGVMMMVVVMHVTEIRVDETVGLNLSCRFKMEMLVWMHSLKVTTLTWGIRSVIVVMISTLLLRILLGLLFLFERFRWLWHFFVIFGLGSAYLRGVRDFFLFLRHLFNFLLFLSLLSSLYLHFLDPFKFLFLLDFFLFL